MTGCFLLQPAMGLALLGCWGFSLGLIPHAVSIGSLGMFAGSILIGCLPLCILYNPASVSSICDDMLDQLNDISFLGDEKHKDRCTHMRHSLMNLNRAQGLGFQMFSTVIDKRMLAKIATGLAGSSVTVITALVALGSDGEEEGGNSGA